MQLNKCLTRPLTLAAALALTVVVARAAPPAPGPAPASGKATMVICSPGSPGTTDEAQPRMDALGAAISGKAVTRVAVVYDPTDAGGVSRFKTAEIGMVSLPFFLQHEKDLGLRARLHPVAKGHTALEKWALVVQKSKVKGPAGLAGFTIMSSVAFSPGFIKGVALGAFGAVPGDVKLQQSTAVLSGLRRAANGDPVAVLLDSEGEAQLKSLPFADKLEVVAHSAEVPAGVIVSIDARMPDRTWAGIEKALLGLGGDQASTSALDGVQLTKFAPLDDKALAAARKSFGEAAGK
ncbi:MAG TPA: hypothetical protein VGC42_23215 [Kofleriaceae bacterium]